MTNGWLIEFLACFKKKGAFNTHKAKQLHNIALLYVDASLHTPNDLCKFVCRFKDLITNLIHVDVPWDDESSKPQFEMVVNHESMLWMLHQCRDMSFMEMIDFFRDTASKGIKRDNNYRQLLQIWVHFAEGNEDTEEEHRILNSQMDASLKNPDDLWYALSPKMHEQVNATRRSMI